MSSYIKDDISDDEFFDCDSDSTKYYAIAFPKDKGQGCVVTNLQEAIAILKDNKNARLFKFDDPLSARRFSEKPLIDEENLKTKTKNNEKKLSDSYPKLKDSERNMFRRQLLTGSPDLVKEYIIKNPRYLISDDDRPVTCRFKYTALHDTAKEGRPEMIKLILSFLSDIEFWNSLFPFPTNSPILTQSEYIQNNYRLMNHMTYLYLNSPDRNLRETPLHFASKYGQEECLRILLSHPLTDSKLTNISKQTAMEVACSRVDRKKDDEESFNSHKDRILSVFSEKYVALLETHCCQITKPLSLLELDEIISKRHYDNCYGDVMHSNVVRAYIGPLKYEESLRLYNRWSVLHSEDAELFDEPRKIDGEKGLEIHGRHLAQEFCTGWHELWHFLDDYLDFGEEEALKKLEKYLIANNTNCSMIEQSNCNVGVFGNSLIEEDQENKPLQSTGLRRSFSNRLSDSLRSLTSMFSRLNLNSASVSTSASQSTMSISTYEEVKEIQKLEYDSDANISVKKLVNKSGLIKQADYNSSLYLQKVPFDMSITKTGYLTPDDRHLRRAIIQRQQSQINPISLADNFPQVDKWMQTMNEIDPFDADPFNESINLSSRNCSSLRMSGNESDLSFDLSANQSGYFSPRQMGRSPKFITSTPIINHRQKSLLLPDINANSFQYSTDNNNTKQINEKSH